MKRLQRLWDECRKSREKHLLQEETANCAIACLLLFFILIAMKTIKQESS